MSFLHALDIEIERIGKGIGDFLSVEGGDEFADGVFDRVARGVAEFAGFIFWQ